MSTYRLPRKINHYRKVFSLTYGDNDGLREATEIVKSAKIYVREDVEREEYSDGIHYGHELVFFIQESLYQRVRSPEKLIELSEGIRAFLEKVTRNIDREYISKVAIELVDLSDEEYMGAIPPGMDELPESETNHLWTQNHVKLFISHRSEHKEIVTQLQAALSDYHISCFVAHRDIEPTRQWRGEILKALRSMDAFLAFITDDFFESVWTNQESGFALARGVTMVLTKVGQTNPKGFIEEFQAIDVDMSDINVMAKKIIEVLLTKMDSKILERSTKERASIIKKQNIIRNFMDSNSYASAGVNFNLLQDIEQLSQSQIDNLVAAYNNNGQLHDCWVLSTDGQFLNFINSRSKREYTINEKGNIEPILEPKSTPDDILLDDLP